MRQRFQQLLAFLPDETEKALADPSFRSPEFCSYLAARIEEMVHHDGETALALATLALRLTAGLPAADRATAWERWSQVQRALGNEQQAASGERLRQLFREEERDPGIRLGRQAVRLAVARRFERAKQVGLQALVAAQSSARKEVKPRVLIDLATVHEVAGEPGDAARRLIEALPELDGDRDGPLYDRVVLALSHAFWHCPVMSHWGKLLVRVRQERFQPETRRWSQLRWLEGLIYKFRDRLERAALTVRPSRRGLIESGTAQEVSLTTLDLADLYLSLGRAGDIAELASETLAVLSDFPLEREALLAFRNDFAEVANRQLTRESIGAVRDDLYRRFNVHALPSPSP